MENQNTPLRDENEQQENVQNESNQQEQQHDEKPKRHGSSAASIDAIITSATDNVRSRRHTSDWSNTGTNISYEGATAPGGGGSVGTGQASGQSATGASIHTGSEYENGGLGRTHTHDEEKDQTGNDTHPEEKDII